MLRRTTQRSYMKPKTKKPKSVKETLEMSKKLIQPAGRWIKEEYKIEPSPGIYGNGLRKPRFCAIGALNEIDGRYEQKACELLHEAIPDPEQFDTVESFNDDDETTHRMVLALYNRAIKLAGQRRKGAHR